MNKGKAAYTLGVFLSEIAGICIVGIFSLLLFLHFTKTPILAGMNTTGSALPSLPPIQTPTITPYTPPKIPKKDFYKIVMVGDSMTEELGVHGGKVSDYLNTLYKSTPGHQRILIDNYAKGSTSVLQLKDMMNSQATRDNTTLQPLLSSQFDVILIESFGYNPLSQFGLQDGLKKQLQTLDETVRLLTATHPQSVIMFVATIAPNKETYAQSINPSSSLQSREEAAQERMLYIENHISYAKRHGIPLIDIFDISLTPSKDGDPQYINPNDNIHPSFAGIDFISHTIANNIYNSRLLPQ